MIAAPDFPGHVIEDGILRRLAPWETLPDPQPARTAAPVSPVTTRVHAVGIGGQWPSAENVERIRQAVAAIPEQFLAAWIRAGGQLEVVPGSNASAHPKFASQRPASGWTAFNSAFCAVAGDRTDAPLTAVHEIGHAVDFVLGYPSRSAAWRAIWQQEKSAGRVPTFTGQQEQPGEFFAEQFALRWDSELRPNRAAQDFFDALI